MNDLERLWREKSDIELEDARNSLQDFTPAARRVVKSELTRRGMSTAPDSPELLAAWKSAAGDAGAEPGAEGAAGDADAGPAGPLACTRCEVPLDYAGTRKFHEGANWGVLGEIGELFVKKESFDVYVCPRCGGVEFFVDGIGEDRRPH